MKSRRGRGIVVKPQDRPAIPGPSQLQPGPSQAPVSQGAVRRPLPGPSSWMIEQPEFPIDPCVGRGARPKVMKRVGRDDGEVRIRDKRGSSGTEIALTANYFTLLESGKWVLNQYRVDFEPEIENTGQKKNLMQTGMQNIVSGYLFDGSAMYTPESINPDPLEIFVRAENGENIKITIHSVGDVKWGDIHYIQLFNIIIRKCLKYMGFQTIGRNYYDADSRIAVPVHKVELWPGYYTSMRQHEKSILMNCDLQFKVLRNDNVYDMLMQCHGPNARKEFQSMIIGNVVLTHYNNRTYKIDDVDFSTTPANTFPLRDGSRISFIDYYRRKYNIAVHIESQPMLVSRSKPKEIRAGMAETVLLIPELCRLTGLTDRQRENFHLMGALVKHTRLDSSQRVNQLIEFSHRLRQCPEAMEVLRQWNLNIADSLVKITGRVLVPEVIIGGNDVKHCPLRPDWTKEIRSAPMCAVSSMRKFSIICPIRYKGSCASFAHCLKRVAAEMKWDIGQPKIFYLSDDRSCAYLDAMDNIIARHSPHMIMCVLCNSSRDRYSAIKKKGCVDHGIPTQVMLAKNLTPKGGPMSVATKIALQLNCKMGGVPWTVTIPLSNLMVVGYDVCRDTANRAKSFSGMVASLDRQISRYYSYTSQHTLEEELSDNFGAFLLVACQRYKEQNGTFPEKILIYRDGVGTGQLPYVYNHEVVNIRRKLKEEIYKEEGSLKMAFIVVSKRINTRIFSGNGNPPPGTVVDDIITLPERYDFFIVSQCVREGTVSPTSYNVIEDTLGLSPDHMQILTYKLCHIYYNWTGTIRVPAPCQYAHKLAFLVAQNLHRPAHRALDNVLYYL